MMLGSLFDGIGGFPLAAVRNGIKTAWASEIEKVPVDITTKHFPDMRHLGDITKISGAKIEPVGIISFGSPCQDLSIAGRREGLDGERSGLFLHAIRIIREMRKATQGNYPKFAIWENVPGAFSSNQRQDFKRVLEEIADSPIPMPQSGRWAKSGMVRGRKCSLAWRVMDAQYWGVPQRRKRIFLVADFTDGRAGEILFKPESLRGYSEKGAKAGQTTAGTAARSLVCDCRGNGAGNICPTLAVHQNRVTDYTAVCIQGNCIDRADTAGRLSDTAYTLSTNSSASSRNAPLVMATGQGNAEIINNIAPTLNCNHEQPIIVVNDQGGNVINIENKAISPTIRAQTHGDLPVVAVDCRNLCENTISGTLQAKSNGGYSLNYQNPVRHGYVIRRLTPLECERLQGFPDGWTEGHSDTQRYKALGNSIAVPCAEYIFKGIAEML